MNIKNVLTEIIVYYAKNRQRGHSTVTLNGVKNTNGKVIVADKSEMLQGFYPMSQCILLGMIPEGLRGRQDPLVFDNHALTIVLNEALNEITRLEKELNIARTMHVDYNKEE